MTEELLGIYIILFFLTASFIYLSISYIKLSTKQFGIEILKHKLDYIESLAWEQEYRIIKLETEAEIRKIRTHYSFTKNKDKKND